MYISNEARIKELELRISKLETKPGVNENLIRKAKRQMRKLSK